MFFLQLALVATKVPLCSSNVLLHWKKSKLTYNPRFYENHQNGQYSKISALTTQRRSDSFPLADNCKWETMFYNLCKMNMLPFYVQISTNVTLGITPVTSTLLATTHWVPMIVCVTRGLVEMVLIAQVRIFVVSYTDVFFLFCKLQFLWGSLICRYQRVWHWKSHLSRQRYLQQHTGFLWLFL